jgi:hypothetical protein
MGVRDAVVRVDSVALISLWVGSHNVFISNIQLADSKRVQDIQLMTEFF